MMEARRADEMRVLEMPDDFEVHVDFEWLDLARPNVDGPYAAAVEVKVSRPEPDIAEWNSGLPSNLAGLLVGVFLDARSGLDSYFMDYDLNETERPYLAQAGLDAMEPDETHLLLIQDVVVDERYRGYRMSLQMAAELIAHCSSGRTIRVMIHPLPHQDYSRQEEYNEADEATQNAMDDADVKAFDKVIRHWERLGFEPERPHGGILTMRAEDFDPAVIEASVAREWHKNTRTRMRSARARKRYFDLRRRYGDDGG